MTPNKPDPTNGEEKMREEIMQMSDVLGDKINDLLEYRGISDCGKSMRGGCDEIIMPYITRKFLELLRQSHLALLEQMQETVKEQQNRFRCGGCDTVANGVSNNIAHTHLCTALDLINTDLRIKIEELKKQQP